MLKLTDEQVAAVKAKAVEIGAGIMKSIADLAGALLAKEADVQAMLLDRTVHFGELTVLLALEKDGAGKAAIQSELDDTHQTIVNETQTLIQDALTASNGWLKSIVDFVLGAAKTLLPIALPMLSGVPVLGSLLSKLG